jgi:hypothetical protein
MSTVPERLQGANITDEGPLKWEPSKPTRAEETPPALTAPPASSERRGP